MAAKCTDSDIVGSEEELSVEVRLLDVIHVGDDDVLQTNHRPVLEQLTAQRSGSHLSSNH